MAWLSGLVPFEQAEEVFERIGHRAAPHSTVYRQAQAYGERIKRYQERQEDRVGLQRTVLNGLDHRQPKGISLDGWMMHIRGEGWKECKVGAVYDIDQGLSLDPRTGEVETHPYATNIGYVGVLGDVAHFAPALWALAVAHQVPTAARSSVTADGAEWIWNVAANYFPDSVQIVDWYHADQHLAAAAQALYPGDEERAGRWRKTMQTALFTGQTWQICQPLDQAGLSDQARYFEHHKRRMQYQAFQEDGYPIGSGTVESGCKQYQARLKGPGMHWSRPGAERMLAIRSAVLSRQFDHLCSVA